MNENHDDIELASRVGTPVLISAETRVQREALARFIHANSARHRGPFVARTMNVSIADDQACLADATSSLPGDGGLRQGFERARGGTFFIDDIATLPRATQAELCRLLEERPIARTSDVVPALCARIIAGASRHLHANGAAGLFCERLFYRLNVVHFNLLGEAAMEWAGSSDYACSGHRLTGE